MIPKPLLDDISKGKVLPIIGAGFSFNADLPSRKSMPSWDSLTEELRSQLQIKNLDRLEVASEYELKFGRVQLIETVGNLLHIDEARPGSVHQDLAKITSFDTIYTTNFDFLLEEAFQHEGKGKSQRPCIVLVGEHQLSFHGGPTTLSIVKMHGDLKHQENIVITKKDYGDYLKRHPVIATHLSSMLITRTALFIGYSLRDPNFNQIRTIIHERLGEFQRMSYLVSFDATEEQIKEYLEQKIHVIRLNSKSRTKAQLLSDFFKEIYDYTTSKATERFPIPTSNLCYAIMPFNQKSYNIYSSIIRPLTEKYGLQLIRADELSATGLILDDIRTTITQSRLIICDITSQNPNVMYQLGLATENKKDIILLAEKLEDVPFDIRGLRILIYETTPKGLRAFSDNLSSAIKHILEG